MNISFGQRIPTAMCQILDTKEKKFEPALICELDCYDKSDIDTIASLEGDWAHKDTIVMNMKNKRANLHTEKGQNARFYTLENNEGDILGITYVDDLEKNVEVRYIESRKDHRYKYVGQNMLATLGQGILNGRQNKLIIRAAVSSAFDFYEKICGFKDIGSSDLEMNRFDIHKFIRRTEERTQSPIVNFRA